MKIMIEHYGTKISYETEKEDSDLDEMCEIFECLLRCMGFHFEGKVAILDEV